MKKPILISPVSSLASLKAAVDAGADGVYFGLSYNMRNSNLSVKDVDEIKKFKIKKYLTLNSVVYDSQLKDIEKIVLKTKDFIDAYICWDMAIIQLLKKYKLDFIISTQASISNLESARFYKKLGAKCLVLARELSLEQIKKIKEGVNIPIEVFVHGSMCMAVSGRCFLSQDIFNKSSNKGRCNHLCRREYLIKDVQEGFEFKLGNHYVLNARDLCTVSFIDKLIESKVDIFKIEGRNKKGEYVKVVTEVYREAIDAYFDGKLDDKLKKKLLEKLKTVYNRGFNQGFFFGKPLDAFVDSTGNKASKKKTFIGKIINYYVKNKIAVLDVRANPVKVGDNLLIIGNKSGVFESKVLDLEIENKKIKKIEKGLVGIKLSKRVREGDEVYLFE